MATLSAAGAAVASLASAPSSEAAALYTDNADLTLLATFGTGIYFDLDQSSAGPTYASNLNFAGQDFRLYFYRGGSLGGETEKPSIVGATSAAQAASSGIYASRLAANALISSSLSFSSSYRYLERSGSGPWQNSFGDAYLGLRIDAGGGDFRYGWARVSYSDAANSMTLKDFAIEQQLNTGILAGDTVGAPAPVPEPGRMMLLALGIGGAALRRRRKTRASAV